MTYAYNPGPNFTRRSSYGKRVDPITGAEGKLHAGQDFKAVSGTPIPAATPGQVIYSGYNENLGNVVIVRNEAGGYSLYGHMLDGNRAEIGPRVWPGDIVGLVGSTGARSTGPHLHYSIITDEAGAQITENGRGPIGIPLKSENTIDPDRYEPKPRFLDGTMRAAGIMSGAGASSTPVDPPLNRQNSFNDRFERWGFAPTTIAPMPTPDDPASLDQRFGNWGSRYAGSAAIGNSPSMAPPDFLRSGMPFVSRPNGSLAAPGGSSLLDPAPMNPGASGPFSSGGGFVPRSLPPQPLYPIGSLVPASNGRAHDRQGLLDDQPGYGNSAPAEEADRFRSPVLRELQKYRQLAASGVATASSSAASYPGLPYASGSVGSGTGGVTGGVSKWIGNGLIGAAEASQPNLLTHGGTAPDFAGQNDGSISNSNEATSPSARDNRRYLSRRIASQASAFDTGVPAVQFVPSNESLSPDRLNAFEDRFGNWPSAPSLTQPALPQQGSRPLGLFSGQPMPDWAVPAPIFGLPDRASVRNDSADDRGLNRPQGTGIPLLDEYIRYLHGSYAA